MDYKLYWTDEALRNLDEIIDYLEYKWTTKEVDSFKLKLSKLLDFILQNPKMFPVSNYVPRLRKAVLSKQTSVFYELKDNYIYIAYMFVNKKDIGQLK